MKKVSIWIASMPVIIPSRNFDRISRNSFQGAFQELAGNFLWDSPEDFLHSSEVKRVLKPWLLQLRDRYRSQIPEQGMDLSPVYAREEFHLSQVVGWDRVIALEEVWRARYIRREFPGYVKHVLEKGQILAPQTHSFTIEVEVTHRLRQHDEVFVVIKDLHPGNNVGPLRGDFLVEKRLFFFDRLNQGESVLLEGEVPGGYYTDEW